MSHRQLTLDERYQIQAMRKVDMSQAEISRVLGRSPSTISRELARNSKPSFTHPYLAKRADGLAQQRRVSKGAASQKIRGTLKNLVERKLRLSWSPEQICGRLLLEQGIKLSHETVYQHILRDLHRAGAGYRGLRFCLRFAGYRHHRFKRSRMAERTRKRKNWIDTRPKAANDRTEIGHWERDLLLGKRGGAALLTIVDRKSRFLLTELVESTEADVVANATMRALDPHRKRTKTITNDNGVEFQRDNKLQRDFGVPIYFTEPASPWQRGTVENMNGLVRQYVPKKANLDNAPKWIKEALEDTLNFRPRKTLGYRTPYEVFYNRSLKLTNQQSLRFGLEISVTF